MTLRVLKKSHQLLWYEPEFLAFNADSSLCEQTATNPEHAQRRVDHTWADSWMFYTLTGTDLWSLRELHRSNRCAALPINKLQDDWWQRDESKRSSSLQSSHLRLEFKGIFWLNKLKGVDLLLQRWNSDVVIMLSEGFYLAEKDNDHIVKSLFLLKKKEK